jgi:hypothetical protein
MTNEETKVDVNTSQENNNQTENNISLTKDEYDRLISENGSFKRDIKEYKKQISELSKSKDESKSDDKVTDSNLLDRLEKISLRNVGIEHEDDVELAKNLSKKWNMNIEDLILDEDFKLKLQRARDDRDNTLATSKIRGNGNSSSTKNTPEYWIAKGQPPTPTDVPNRTERYKIINAMRESSKNSKKFYND